MINNPAVAVDYTEVSTLANDITRGLVIAGLPLPPTDGVLAARGGDYRAWDWVLQDPLVASCFQQRRLALVSRQWVVEPGGSTVLDRKAADSLKAQLERIGWDRSTSLMLFGVMYGFAVAELLYARDGTEIVLDAIAVRKQRRFCFDGSGALRLRTLGAPLGLELPEQKFWHFAVGADNADEPYGVGLASWLYWPVWLKRSGQKAWVTFLEKFAMPTVVGTYPATASEQDKDLLLRSAAALASSSAVRLPEGHALTFLEAARSGTAEYGGLDEVLRDTITQVILSQTMTTHAGASLAQARVHEGVKQEIIKADGDLITDSFTNGPARWLTEWNYPGAAVPCVRRIIEDTPDRKALADTDATLFGLGYRRTAESINEVYGAGYQDLGPPRAAAGGGGGVPSDLNPAFAEGGTAPLPHGPTTGEDYGALLAPAADDIVAGWISQIKAVLDDSTLTMAQVWPRLLALDIDPSALTDLMTEAMTAADLAGRYDVQQAALADQTGAS